MTTTEIDKPEAPTKNKASVVIAYSDLLTALHCLRLLKELPPTICQIIEAGEHAINLSGINPWVMNEGLAAGNEVHVPWRLDGCIQSIESAISQIDDELN